MGKEMESHRSELRQELSQEVHRQLATVFHAGSMSASFCCDPSSVTLLESPHSVLRSIRADLTRHTEQFLAIERRLALGAEAAAAAAAGGAAWASAQVSGDLSNSQDRLGRL